MGKFSRDKGYRVENNLRKQILTHENMECIRVPLSGGASIKGELIFNKKALAVLDLDDLLTLIEEQK